MTAPVPSVAAHVDVCGPAAAARAVSRGPEARQPATELVSAPATAPAPAVQLAPARRPWDWILPVLVLVIVFAATVALLVPLWLRPASGTVAP